MSKSKKCVPCRYCGNLDFVFIDTSIGEEYWGKSTHVACKKCGAMGPSVVVGEFPMTPVGLDAKDDEMRRRWNILNSGNDDI